MADEERSPIDDLVDLLLYAPVGMLYEYEDVLPRLIRRGKSQVQLAKVLGQMASRGGGAVPVNEVVETVAKMLAERITEIGSSIGLAPPAEADEGQATPDDLSVSPDDAATDDADTDDAGSDATRPDQPLPIATYDTLTAREIVGLLDDLDAGQLARVRAHEQANRARKTVLGKLDRLGA